MISLQAYRTPSTIAATLRIKLGNKIYMETSSQYIYIYIFSMFSKSANNKFIASGAKTTSSNYYPMLLKQPSTLVTNAMIPSTFLIRGSRFSAK
jgi:hypothetical protein